MRLQPPISAGSRPVGRRLSALSAACWLWAAFAALPVLAIQTETTPQNPEPAITATTMPTTAPAKATADASLSAEQQRRLDALTALGKSAPRQANQQIEQWLTQLPAGDLLLREKLTTAKAFNLMVLAEYQSAEQLLQQWLALISNSRPELSTRALEILGAIEMRRGHIDKAQHWLAQALTLADRYDQTERKITARIYSAMQAIYAGQDDAALDLLLLAQQMNQQARFEYLRVNIENNLSSVRIRLGQYQQALDSLLPALRDPAYQPADRLYVHFSIASAWVRLGRFADAKPHLQQAFTGYRQREDPYYLSALHLLDAEIALHSQQLTAARQAIEQCIALAAAQQLTEQLADAYLLASKISQLQQNPQQAFDELQQHLQYYKQVRTQQTQRQTLLLRSQLESLQQQHQIRDLQAQLDLKALEQQQRQRLWGIGLLSASLLFGLLLLVLQLQRKKRRQAELHSAELAASFSHLQQTQRQLITSEKMAALAGLVAGLAHELNTPLGVLTTAASLNSEKTQEFAEKFASGLRKSDIEDYLQTALASQQLCLHNIERASLLVQSFKRLAMPADSAVSTFWLDALLTDLSHLQASRLREKQVQLDFSDSHLQLHADPQHFQLLLLELLSNALNHAFTDQPERHIKVRAWRCHDGFMLCFQDNGQGLSAGASERAFEPFYTTGRPAGHTGLGLSLVYNLVTLALGGQIWLEDAKPGLRVQLQLPGRWLAR